MNGLESLSHGMKKLAKDSLRVFFIEQKPIALHSAFVAAEDRIDFITV